MADITKYPNPLRLFTKIRDEWFTDLVENYEIPMYIFSAVRDTQLGQLMYAIETVRMKKRRAGEDPGPGLLEGENATNFIPLFNLVKQFQNFIFHEELNLEQEQIEESFFSSDPKKQLSNVAKTGREWFTPLSLERLDELYIQSFEIFKMEVIQPILELLELDDLNELKTKVTEINENLGDSLFRIYDENLYSALSNAEIETDEEDQSRSYSIDGEEHRIEFREYHSKVNVLYTFILELDRYISNMNNYNYEFKMLEPLLTLEMLVMIPQPDSERLPLIKEHLSTLSESTDLPQAFWNILTVNYRTYSRMEETDSRMVKKLFNNFERQMKNESRSFWSALMEEKENYEELIAVLWSHLRAVQSRAQHNEQQTNQHSQAHIATVRMEHIFWIQGTRYYKVDDFETPIQFWSAYAAIANKQVRNEKDSLKLFNELDGLLQNTRVLTNKKQRKSLVVNNADRYSLIQRILSYGLEARTSDVYDRIEKYLVLLEKLLEEIKLEEMHESFSIEEERKAIKDIRKHMENNKLKASSN